VELPAEKVPVIQKHVIARAAEWRKPVIIATQMLESMIESPRPTRAEASDVANAIFDGTDAVMLSGETASGKYPREAVNMMSRIVLESRSKHGGEPRATPDSTSTRADKSSISETICDSIAHAAEDLDMGAIAVFTQSGHTAKLVSKYRPKCQFCLRALRNGVPLDEFVVGRVSDDGGVVELGESMVLRLRVYCCMAAAFESAK